MPITRAQVQVPVINPQDQVPITNTQEMGQREEMGGEPYVVMIPFPGDLGETIEPVE
jgi:hypothetical protein